MLTIHCNNRIVHYKPNILVSKPTSPHCLSFVPRLQRPHPSGYTFAAKPLRWFRSRKLPSFRGCPKTVECGEPNVRVTRIAGNNNKWLMINSKKNNNSNNNHHHHNHNNNNNNRNKYITITNIDLPGNIGWYIYSKIATVLSFWEKNARNYGCCLQVSSWACSLSRNVRII